VGGWLGLCRRPTGLTARAASRGCRAYEAAVAAGLSRSMGRDARTWDFGRLMVVSQRLKMGEEIRC
jgi:hypothetical protein